MSSPSETETETAGVAAARRALAAQLTGRTNRLFYFVVLAVALVGSSTAAQDWLFDGKPAKWHLLAALVAVAVYELGAVAVSRFADQRRQLGERALVARIASASLAAGAIAAQALGHDEKGPAAFFAGVSLTGYVIYLLEAAANRRDAMRRDGKLADTPPAYGWFQWFRHFWITRRARALALARAEARLLDKSLPPLGRVASLEAAAKQIRAEKRLAAIEEALRARIAAGVDKTMATIAVNTYDMPTVAAGIAAAADYPALTRIITSELVPARLVKLDDPAGDPAGDVAAAEDQGATVAAEAIVEHVAAELAAAAPATVATPPATVALDPPATVAEAPAPIDDHRPVSAPPAPETAPVPPAPAAGETGPETETVAVPRPPATRRVFPREPLPPSLASMRAAHQGTAADTPPAPPAEPETAPVPAPEQPETAPAEPETVPVSAPAETAPDQGETEETDPETAPETAPTNAVDPLAGVEAKLVPYLVTVTTAVPGWAAAVKMPPRHPEALSVPKIKEVTGKSGKQLCCDIRNALLDLAEHPETAEAALRSHGLAAAGSN
jgi:hypothetical protein